MTAGDDRRTRILQAAFDLIADNGIRGLRLEEVAEKAGVAVSLIYYHFGNRIDLLGAVFSYASEIASVRAHQADAGSSALEQLEFALLEELHGSKARRTAIVWNELNATAIFMPELRSYVRSTNSRWLSDVEDLIRAGQADGSVRADADPRDQAQILGHLVDGLLPQWLIGSITKARVKFLLRQAIEQTLSP